MGADFVRFEPVVMQWLELMVNLNLTRRLLVEDDAEPARCFRNGAPPRHTPLPTAVE